MPATAVSSNTSSNRSYQQQVFSFISSIIGQNNNVVMPIELIRFAGDYHTAALLSQLIYWQGKQRDPEGWIWKTYDQWEQELALSKYQVSRSAKALVRMGILETKVARVKLDNGMYGDKAVHYRLIDENFIEMFGKHLSILESKETSLSKSEKVNDQRIRNFTSFPITETTSKTTTDIPELSPPPKQPEPPELPQKETSPSFSSSENNKTTTADVNQTGEDIRIDDLLELIPEDMRKPSIENKIKQAVAAGIALEIIKGCIMYSNDQSDKKTWQRYRSHLGKCIDNQWGEGYTQDAGKEDQAQAFLESRRSMPDSVLQLDAARGCQVSAQVLKERGNAN